MVKFKFNYQTNSLAYQHPYDPECWYEISTENQFEGQFGSQGFQLTEGWMSFTLYQNKIRVFYKQMRVPSGLDDFWEPQQVTYYRKDLPKSCPVIFTFTSQDEVEKVEGKWVKKGECHM